MNYNYFHFDQLPESNAILLVSLPKLGFLFHILDFNLEKCMEKVSWNRTNFSSLVYELLDFVPFERYLKNIFDQTLRIYSGSVSRICMSKYLTFQTKLVVVVYPHEKEKLVVIIKHTYFLFFLYIINTKIYDLVPAWRCFGNIIPVCRLFGLLIIMHCYY